MHRIFLLFLLIPSLAFGLDLELRWDRTVQYVDGTPLLETAKYRVHWGAVSGVYPNTQEVNTGIQTVIEGLEPGIYYFAVTAHLDNGNKSDYSDELKVQLTLEPEPAAPGNFRCGIQILSSDDPSFIMRCMP